MVTNAELHRVLTTPSIAATVPHTDRVLPCFRRNKSLTVVCPAARQNKLVDVRERMPVRG